MNKLILIVLMFGLIFSSCSSDFLIIENSSNSTNNITNSFNITNNFTTINNITNNISTTNNITNNLSDGYNFVYLINDFYFATTTLQTIENGSSLAFNFTAGDVIVFDVVLFGNWHATPDIRFRADVTGTANGKVSSHNIEQAVDRVDDLDVTQASLAMATGNDINKLQGTLEASTDGRLEIQIRQNTASADVQRVDKYSYIKWRKIN